MTAQGTLNGKTALVTGSVQGIGLGVATALAEAGAKIALHGLAEVDQVASATQVLKSAGAPEVQFFGHDVSDEDAINDLMDEAQDWSGGIDILVNNAGIQKTASIEEVEPETWNKIIDINLSAAFRTTRRALPGMAERGYGRVVNISSVHGLVASINKAPYVAAKHGLIGLSKVAALEYADVGSKQSGGVTVNCICPGWTETALIGPQIDDRAAQLGVERDEAAKDLLAEKQPSLRTSDPSEIGALIVWLCNPIAHNVTGTAMPIDGGWTAQ